MIYARFIILLAYKWSGIFKSDGLSGIDRGYCEKLSIPARLKRIFRLLTLGGAESGGGSRRFLFTALVPRFNPFGAFKKWAIRIQGRREDKVDPGFFQESGVFVIGRNEKK